MAEKSAWAESRRRPGRTAPGQGAREGRREAFPRGLLALERGRPKSGDPEGASGEAGSRLHPLRPTGHEGRAGARWRAAGPRASSGPPSRPEVSRTTVLSVCSGVSGRSMCHSRASVPSIRSVLMTLWRSPGPSRVVGLAVRPPLDLVDEAKPARHLVAGERRPGVGSATQARSSVGVGPDRHDRRRPPRPTARRGRRRRGRRPPPGWAFRTASTSSGNTFSPPVLMRARAPTEQHDGAVVVDGGHVAGEHPAHAVDARRTWRAVLASSLW